MNRELHKRYWLFDIVADEPDGGLDDIGFTTDNLYNLGQYVNSEFKDCYSREYLIEYYISIFDSVTKNSVNLIFDEVDGVLYFRLENSKAPVGNDTQQNSAIIDILTELDCMDNSDCDSKKQASRIHEINQQLITKCKELELAIANNESFRLGFELGQQSPLPRENK